MISLDMALSLRGAGLEWRPALHDFFAIPNSELEQRVFVVSDMTVDVERLLGDQMITFNGAVEWSLDFIWTKEVVWMPTEAQLREQLQRLLMGEDQPAVHLASYDDGYQCTIAYQGELLSYEADEASDAYAMALLDLLERGAAGSYRPRISA